MGLLDWLRGARERKAEAVTPTGPPVQPTFAVIDVETTGLTAASHRILELAVVLCDEGGGVVDEWVTRLNPQGPVGATHIHGITEHDVADAPLFRHVVADLTARLAGTVLVAHNARFDTAFLRAEFTRAGWALPPVPAVCTLEESRRLLPDLTRRRLADCCGALAIRHTAAHSALGDARAAAGLMAQYLRIHQGLGPYRSLCADARSLAWPSEPAGAVVPSTPARREPLRVRTAPRPQNERLVRLLDGLALAEALPEDAPEGALSYLELLAEVLEDGVLTDDEAAALTDVAGVYDLTPAMTRTLTTSFLIALATKAVDDGVVSRTERDELYAVAGQLGVDRRDVLRALDAAIAVRNARHSRDLPPLPAEWRLGQPLRVGDSVAFTGCEDAQRTSLEDGARAAGVRVTGSVSRSTAMLITDGSFAGTKLEAARRHGTRIVDPGTFEVLLAHVQPTTFLPAVESAQGASSSDPEAPDIPPPSAGGATAVRTAPETSPARIREWARAQGWEVGERGRLSVEVRAAFHAAHVTLDADSDESASV